MTGPILSHLGGGVSSGPRPVYGAYGVGGKEGTGEGAGGTHWRVRTSK
jgi:hypothetical protein